MKKKTVVTSTVIDREVKNMMDAYIDESGVLTAVLLDKALALYEEVGHQFEGYEIKEPIKFAMRVYEDSKIKVDILAKDQSLKRNFIWNQAIRDYLSLHKKD